jgi:diacylglycerol kinase (ATP)
MRNKWVFIVNPVAGSGAASSQMPALEKMIARHNIDAEIVFTSYKGHAAELSSDYLEKGFSYIIGVGGDGTFNEIARPLIEKPGIIVGLIPAGTGNDFIQITGFPSRFSETDWEMFFRKNVILMDAGRVNGMIFLNGMGLGFDAQVASENYDPKGNVKEGAKNRYIWQIIKTLLFFREKRMIALTENGSSETDCFINTIAIGRRFAGGFLLTPEAIANDGLLDVCSIKRLSLAERFNILLKVPEGKHINDRRIHYYQTPSVSLEFPEAVPFHVDGELFYQKKFDVTLIREALNIIYNPDGPHFFRR